MSRWLPVEPSHFLCPTLKKAQEHHHSRCLRRTLKDFCRDQQPLTAEHEEAWLLQRDITYALILPVLEIYRYARQLATSMLGDRNLFDLELVFRGEAQGAFAWLQCFIAEEKDFCMMRGCPGISSCHCQPLHIAKAVQHVW